MITLEQYAAQRMQQQATPAAPPPASRDYRSMYRAAFEYHKRHDPPTVDRDYWQQHTPGKDETPQAELDFWHRAAQDAGEVIKRFGNDSFIVALICDIYAEIEKQYTAGRLAAAGAFAF